MLKLSQIAYNSLTSTNRFPRWWILAFFQAVAFALVGKFARPALLLQPAVYWLAVGLIVLQPITVWLWLDMQQVKAKNQKNMSALKFLNMCLVSGSVTVCAVAILIFARFLYDDWVFLTVFSSLVAGTSALAVLYVVLCGQKFTSAWFLALDTWHKKVSLAVAVALVIMVAHGVAFILVHAVWLPLYSRGEFSVLNHSATIWILSVVLSLIVAYFAAILNSFLVFLFLEIIQRKEVPEAEKAAMSLATAQVSS